MALSALSIFSRVFILTSLLDWCFWEVLKYHLFSPKCQYNVHAGSICWFLEGFFDVEAYTWLMSCDSQSSEWASPESSNTRLPLPVPSHWVGPAYSLQEFALDLWEVCWSNGTLQGINAQPCFARPSSFLPLLLCSHPGGLLLLHATCLVPNWPDLIPSLPPGASSILDKVGTWVMSWHRAPHSYSLPVGVAGWPGRTWWLMLLFSGISVTWLETPLTSSDQTMRLGPARILTVAIWRVKERECPRRKKYCDELGWVVGREQCVSRQEWLFLPIAESVVGLSAALLCPLLVDWILFLCLYWVKE